MGEHKIREKEDLLDSVRDEYEELGLEYDETEVKRALEVNYLLEQISKVQEDKVRLEKELLAALFERDQQIVQLRNETDELSVKLDRLNKEKVEEAVILEEAAEAEDAFVLEKASQDVSEDSNGEESKEDESQPELCEEEVAQETPKLDETAIDETQKEEKSQPELRVEEVVQVTPELEETKIDETQKEDEPQPESREEEVAQVTPELEETEVDETQKAEGKQTVDKTKGPVDEKDPQNDEPEKN